jgi:cytochrome d ubiquinol oxidase subunit I
MSLDVLDAELLARAQFAFTVSFHIIFPSFTIGLAAFIATLLVRFRLTGEEKFHRLARFWTKIFAVSFAMGVVSGIVLSYQFGTNWARFSEVTGNVIGPLIGYEVLTAFFLDASFLGILLFGWSRFPPNVHLLSAVLVALGTSLSAFWILAANSWMQTPCELVLDDGTGKVLKELCGHEMENGVAVPTDWWRIIFNPSFPYRFLHMFTAAYLTTSLVVIAVGARYLVTGRFIEEARTMMRMGLGMVACLAPLQLLIGDQHGLNTLHYQPAKVAAMEAHWKGDHPGAMVLFAIPNETTGQNDYEWSIPNAASLILRHDWEGKFPGLDDDGIKDARPPVLPVFFAFRIMVGLGLVMIALGAVGAVLWWRRRLFEARWYLVAAQNVWPLGFIAILAGWWVTETGRQPWIVTGILSTRDALSPNVTAGAVAATLVLFVLVYTSVFGMGIYYINKLIDKGPEGAAGKAPEGMPSRPLSAASEAAREAIEGAG